MFKSLARILLKKIAPGTKAPAAPIQDDTAPIYESLAMTEELREALFPKTPQMVYAIFERPVSSHTPPPPQGPERLCEDGADPIV